MNAVFIAGIEVRLALKSRSDALPVCRLGIGAGQISVRIHRPVWPPRPRSPRSPKDAHAPSSHRARSSEPLRALSSTHRRCRTPRRRKLHAPSFPAAAQRRCRTYRLSQRRLACRPICGIGRVGKGGLQRQHHDRNRDCRAEGRRSRLLPHTSVRTAPSSTRKTHLLCAGTELNHPITRI